VGDDLPGQDYFSDKLRVGVEDAFDDGPWTETMAFRRCSSNDTRMRPVCPIGCKRREYSLALMGLNFLARLGGADFFGMQVNIRHG